MRSLRTVLGMLLLAVGGALAAVVVTAAPASACSCAMGDQADYLEWSDVVFTGEVVDSGSGDDGGTYRLDVDRVYQGEVPADAELATGGHSAMCGYGELEVGTAYVVYATAGDGGRFSTSLCSGTREMRASYVERLEQYAGSGYAPGDAHPGSATASAAAAASDERSGVADRPVTLGLVGGGAAVVIAAALLLGRRRSQ